MNEDLMKIEKEGVHGKKKHFHRLESQKELVSKAKDRYQNWI